jgi:PAS domain S-box-containing protein
MGAAPTDDRLFRAVFEGTLDALLLTDDEGTYVDANEAATDLFGCPREELIGRSVGEFARPGFDLESAWETFLEDGEMRGEFDICRPDGEVRTAEFVASADILPGIHLSALRDISERTEARAELARRTEMLSKVFETSPVGIVVIDADGTITDANGRAEAVLGLERSEITGRTYDDPRWEIVDDDGAPLSGENLPAARVLETGEPVFDFEHGIEHPDGETVWLSVNAAPIHDPDGDISKVVSVVSDITDRREYRRLLEQQNERLEEYSATVSHDLRSPLSVASGWLDIAMDEGSTEYLEKADEALDRMGQLITDLRALGRYGQTVEGMTELDLGAVASEAWANVETGAATLRIESGLDTIGGEHGRLLQLFENLFRNAVEHGSTGGQPGADDTAEQSDPSVTVRVGPLDGGSGFYVADDGPGIPAEERENVFEFGYSTRPDGTGIGLAIVEAVADAHGWGLDLVDAEGGGARFEFRPRWHPDHRDRYSDQ